MGVGLCPHVSDRDPYEMAVAATDEALRNVICVGGDPERTAILDNFCWGEVESPRALGALVRACKGAYDAAVAYGLPFISGKDSLNNRFTMSAAEAARVDLPADVSIPDTLLISAISVVEDVAKCITMDLKRPGNRLYLIGPMRGSALTELAEVHRSVAGWIDEGKVCSAHDVSDGGLAVTLAEMCIGGELGAAISLEGMFSGSDSVCGLFEEGCGRYVVECEVGVSLESEFARGIGEVCESPQLTISRGAARRVELSLARLQDAWRVPLARGEVEPDVLR